MRYLLISFFLLLFSVPGYALQLEMVDAPIADFSKWVAEKTDTNIILGDGVSGQITFNAQSVQDDDVLSFFTAVMSAYKFKTDISGSTVSVVTFPKTDSKQADLPPLLSLVVPVHNLLAVDIVNNVDYLVHGLSRGSAHVLPGNNILIVSTADVLPIASKMVSSIDVHRLSYLVEAVVFETQINKSDRLGIQYSVGDSTDGFFSAFTGSDLVDLSVLPAGLVSQLLKVGSFSALVDVIKTSDNSKILSTPKIYVVDGSSGRISVGQNVPFVTGKSVTPADGTSNPFQTIERKDVGVSLDVSPVTISHDLIQLSIRQLASSLSRDTFASDVITNKRSIDTTVQLAPGQVVQIGGLVSNDDVTTDTSVPFFGSIPFIGRLFHGSRIDHKQRLLTVFLRLTVV